MFNINKKETDKSSLSLPKTRKVCGYEIKKMPIGAYLSAIEKIKDLPVDFLNRCFPGLTLQEVFDKLSTIDETGLVELVTALFGTLPEYLIGFVSELTGIPEESLLNDDNIGLDGLVDIIKVFIEVNQLGKLTGEAGEIKALISLVKGIATPEYWLQRLIACALTMGISKSELLNDYYMDEIGEIMHEHNKLHTYSKDEETAEVDGTSFFGF